MFYGGLIMKRYLINYIKENSKIITIFLLSILIGVVSGIIIYQFSSEQTKIELKDTVVNTLNISKQDNFDGINIIKNGISTNLILIILVYFSSLTMICPILISLINMIKGISIGIYVPILFSVFGIYNGIIALLLLIIIPNLFYLPAFVFLSTNALSLHYIITEKLKESRTKILIKHLTYIVIGFSFIFLSVLLEQILSVNIISIYKKI